MEKICVYSIEMARRRNNVTRKVLRIPQKALNSVLGIVGATRKGSLKVARRAGRGAYGITGSALGTARNVSKTAVGTVGNIGVRTTRGLTKLVKNSINLASNVTKKALKGVTRGVNGRKRHTRRH
jgi:hypothetical protein